MGNAVVPIENGLHFFLSWSPATEFFPFLFEVFISLSALWRHNSHTIKPTILRGKTQCLQASCSIKLPLASSSAFRTINHPKEIRPVSQAHLLPHPWPHSERHLTLLLLKHTSVFLPVPFPSPFLFLLSLPLPLPSPPLLFIFFDLGPESKDLDILGKGSPVVLCS